MLQNPIHLRLGARKAGSMSLSWLAYANAWHPNYAMFCQQAGFGDGAEFTVTFSISSGKR